MIQRIIIIFSKYTARTDIDRSSKKITKKKKRLPLRASIKQKAKGLTMYVSYKEVLLFRGAFPYMFTISAVKNIVLYSKDFVRGSLKPRFHSSVINWSRSCVNIYGRCAKVVPFFFSKWRAWMEGFPLIMCNNHEKSKQLANGILLTLSTTASNNWTEF